MDHSKKLAFDTAEKLLIATLEDSNIIPAKNYGSLLGKEFKALYEEIIPIAKEIMNS